MTDLTTKLSDWTKEILVSKPWRKPEVWLAILILLIALVSRFYDLESRAMSHDESEHAYFSWYLAEHYVYHHTPITHGPFQFHLLALTYTILGDTDASSRFPAAICGVIAIAMLFYFKRWFGRWGAIAAMVFMLISPYMLFYTRYVRNEALILPFALLMFISIIRYFETHKSKWLYLLAGALTAHYLIKETAFIYVIEIMLFMGALFVWRVSKMPWKSRGHLVTFLSGVAAFLIGAAILFFRIRTVAGLEGDGGPSPILFVGLGVALAGLAALLYALVKTFGARLQTEFPSLDVLVVCITLTLPQLAAFPANLLGWDPLDYQNTETMLRTAMVVVALITMTAIIGLFWNWHKWQTVAVIFFIPYFILYTTVFTNWAGMATGMVGSFGYWLAQQEVERGGQPLYYYFAVQIPIYEYLLAFISLLAAGLGLGVVVSKNRARVSPENVVESEEQPKTFPTIGFFGYWTVISLLVFSYAGERMPWLTVHIALPMILLSGWVVRYLIDLWKRREELALNVIGVGALIVILGLSILTARTAFRASYVNYDYATEYLVYAHSEAGVKNLLGQIEEVAETTGDGINIKVAYDTSDGAGDSGVSWPLTWYFRHYPNARSYGPEITRDLRSYPVLVSSNNNWGRLEPLLEDNFQQFEHLRMVWPMQDYWNLTWERISEALGSPEYRRALWEIWLNRDYQSYGEIVGKDYSHENWQPSDPMRLYVRNDVAYDVWGIGEPSEFSDDISSVDPYQDVLLDINADLVVGSPGSDPGQLQNPRTIAFAPDGSLYVADSSNHRIQHLSPEGQVLHVWGTFADTLQENAPGGSFYEPWGVAVGPDGSVYVADTWNHRIQKFTAEGDFLTMWGSFGTADPANSFWGPRAIALDSQGRVFVSDTGNKRISVFDQDGQFMFHFGVGGYGPGQLDEPVGLDIASDGVVFVVDTWNQRIQAFQEQSPGFFSAIREWAVSGWYGQSLENKPYLAVGPRDEICITDPEGYRILCFDSNGQFLFGWGSYGTSDTQFNMPSALAFDPQGRLWISDSQNGRLMRFQLP